MTLNRKERKSVNKTRTAIGAVGLAALLTLTGCGNDDSDGSTDSAPETTSAPMGGPGGLDSEQFEKIQGCLEAAGLEDKLPSDMPTEIPSDMPTDFPSDIPSGAPGGGLGALQDPEVQDALEACGIDLSPRPRTGQS